MKRFDSLRLAAITALAMTLFALPVQAQDYQTQVAQPAQDFQEQAIQSGASYQNDDYVDEFGIFDHLSVGVVLGTTGIGVDLAAPVTNYLQVRAGFNFFPAITYSEDVDYRAKGKPTRGHTVAEGKTYNNSGHLLIDVYPFANSSFHATAGFYLGTEEVAKIENLEPVKDFNKGEGIVIGDHIVEFDQNGYAHGAIKVNSFRPYLGIGIGRSVPRKRFAVSGDLGVQFWGTPKVYEKQTGMDLEVTKDDLGSDSDKYYDMIAKFPVFPVLTIRITGRLF